MKTIYICNAVFCLFLILFTHEYCEIAFFYITYTLKLSNSKFWNWPRIFIIITFVKILKKYRYEN